MLHLETVNITKKGKAMSRHIATHWETSRTHLTRLPPDNPATNLTIEKVPQKVVDRKLLGLGPPTHEDK